MNEGETITTEQGGKHSYVAARLDLVPPENALLLGECLGFGAKKYGEENWHGIPERDNLNHAMVHVTKWMAGDRGEPHLVNALARLHFALWHAIKSGEQPKRYEHPEIENAGHDRPQPANETPKNPPLAVGQRWETRDGRRVHIWTKAEGSCFFVRTLNHDWQWRVTAKGLADSEYRTGDLITYIDG